MSQFDEREQAYESKFKMDQETEFRAMARRNKLLGLWLAEQFDFGEDKAQDYAKEVIASDLEEPGDEDVVRKVMADIGKYGIDISDYLLRKKMQELLDEAYQQIKQESH